MIKLIVLVGDDSSLCQKVTLGAQGGEEVAGPGGLVLTEHLGNTGY